LNGHFIDLNPWRTDIDAGYCSTPGRRMRTNRIVIRDARKRNAGRCFSAATGACR
jgi:hypothetical protein